MSGIYLHIPFCKKACHYCDFHFSTSLALKDEMISAISKEIELRTEKGEQIETIYFGGGTPSLLSKEEISIILNTIHKHFRLSENVQITLEANPDDLTRNKLEELKQAGIDRLSIGVQSFFEEDLSWMNRSHNSTQAIQSLMDAREIGFSELNLDLIFGFPLLSDEKWQMNIERALSFGIQHISAYSMTVEDKTALAYQIAKGQTAQMEEGQAARQYKQLMTTLGNQGWEHYEISNFCLPGYRSKHNTSYWQNKNYIGIGPSAHGYKHPTRYWNIANNAAYIKQLNNGELASEQETLNKDDQYNEYLMTRLRLKEGIVKDDFLKFNSEKDWTFLIQQSAEYSQYFETSDIYLRLNQEGKLLADYLISELFRA